MVCKKCKVEIPESSVFCNLCGKKQVTTSNSGGRMRANGEGSVYQLPNGKWRAVKTLGYTVDQDESYAVKQKAAQISSLKKMPSSG